MATILSYRFDADDNPVGQRQQLDHPLFGMLAAIREEGSIGRAATRLGLSYRHIWGEIKKAEGQFGKKLVVNAQGEAARLSPFGEDLLWAEARVRARVLPETEVLAAKLDNALLLATQPQLASLAICASHDQLFGLLRETLLSQRKVLLDTDYQDGPEALESLNQGSCVLAGLPLPLDAPQLCQRNGLLHRGIGRHLRLDEHQLIRLATRRQGLMVQAGNPLGLGGLADLQRDHIRFINRKAGSGTRFLFDALLTAENLQADGINGYLDEEATHFSVAAAVAAGAANCGFGLQAAAARFGLDFVPILTEQYWLACRKAMMDNPGVQAVINALASEDFKRRAEELPGYGAEGAGQLASLRRTLPWYK